MEIILKEIVTIMAKRKKYTEAQKKAYYSGMGYVIAQAGKRIDFKSPENKECFVAGMKKGKEKIPTLQDKKGGNNK